VQDVLNDRRLHEDPPFDSGSPDTAPAAILARLKERNAAGQEYRRAANRRAAARLKSLDQSVT
jgi:hypothetical protein